MDSIFHVCVQILQHIAFLTNTTYETVNVVIFCVLVPAGFAYLIWSNIRLSTKLYEATDGREGKSPGVMNRVARGLVHLFTAGVLILIGYSMLIANLIVMG